MGKLRVVLIILAVLVPILLPAFSYAEEKVKEGKIEWFIDDVNRLNKAEDFRSDVSSVWPGEKIHEGGYVLPGSVLQLHYRSHFNMYLTMLQYSPDGQIIPLFVNDFNRFIPTETPILKYDLKIPPIEGRGAVMLIASKYKLGRDEIAQVAKNPDDIKYPDRVASVSFCHYYSVDYVNTMIKGVPQYGEGQGQAYGQQGGGAGGGGYNQPIYNQGYNQGGVNPQQGPYGPQPIPLQQMGPTYYFYPSGWVSKNYYPYPYYYPYYYYRPGFYGNPNQYRYLPPGYKYYVNPSGNGVKTNLYDFIVEGNFDYGQIVLGQDGFLGGKFFIDGNNPAPDGLTFRFPSKNIWEHEGPDGSWTYYMPDDFQFLMNGQPLPIYGGGQYDPFLSIPLQGFLINGLNEFKLLPKANDNYYGIGPIEISADIKF
jgi:hypothetical protein